jgi:peptidylprolyl isomerase
MNNTFLLAIMISSLALVIFAYFIFGLNGTTRSENSPQKEADSVPTPHVKLQIVDEKIGTGAAVTSGDTININYIGTLTNGTKFDSSYDRKQPFTTQIGVGQVIKGWDEGVIGMKVGGKRKLIIPPALGYGDQTVGSIPPNSTLIFEVELEGIQ